MPKGITMMVVDQQTICRAVEEYMAIDGLVVTAIVTHSPDVALDTMRLVPKAFDVLVDNPK